MNAISQTITKQDLKALGLSDYLVREIVGGMSASQKNRGVAVYDVADAIASIQKKMSKPKTQVGTRKKLNDVLARLQKKSKVIQVDFLKKMPLERKAEALKERIEADDLELEMIWQDYEKLQKQVGEVLGTT